MLDERCGLSDPVRVMRVSTSSELQEQAEKCLLAAQRAVQPEVQRAYLDLMGGLIELAALMARLDQKSELRK